MEQEQRSEHASGSDFKRLVMWFWSVLGQPGFYAVVAVVDVVLDTFRGRLGVGTLLIVLCCILFQFLAHISNQLEVNNRLWGELIAHIKEGEQNEDCT